MAIVFALVWSLEGWAMWAPLTPENLKASALIVRGEILAVSPIRLSPQLAPMAVAVLKVEQGIRGAADAVVLLVVPAPGAPLASDGVSVRVGQRGLWFLRLYPDGEGLYLADHPQRFVPEAEVSQRLRELGLGD